MPFTGTGLITGTAGTKLTFKIAPGSTGCGDEKGEIFSITGHATVLKGTGKLAKAKGTLKFTGIYDHTAGTFSVKFFGTLTRLGRNETYEEDPDSRRRASPLRRYSSRRRSRPDPVPFPATTVVQVFVATQTVTTERRDGQLLRAGLDRRLPCVCGRPEDEESPHRQRT